FSTSVEVEKLTGNLCGISRPGHFKGVSTVVAKLFEITKPDIAYFGQKDAQQAAVIKRMVADLNMDVMIKILPIIRETDGLAMSSRNAFLKKNEREDALILQQSLKRAEDLFVCGERSSKRLVSSIKEMIDSKKTVRVDYVKVVDSETLKDVDQIKDKALIALAVFIGKTRLIDNALLKVQDD
ncbi:MAG: pantoate--beta-alanine ligase, partial [Candidatus Omnitrophica bacterium]|nr:pantoate--beta-alanine ligase [Candidatus Omnitrophota bacterium]